MHVKNYTPLAWEEGLQSPEIAGDLWKLPTGVGDFVRFIEYALELTQVSLAG